MATYDIQNVPKDLQPDPSFCCKLASPIEVLSTVVSIAILAAVPPYNKLYTSV